MRNKARLYLALVCLLFVIFSPVQLLKMVIDAVAFVTFLASIIVAFAYALSSN